MDSHDVVFEFNINKKGMIDIDKKGKRKSFGDSLEDEDSGEDTIKKKSSFVEKVNAEIAGSILHRYAMLIPVILLTTGISLLLLLKSVWDAIFHSDELGEEEDEGQAPEGGFVPGSDDTTSDTEETELTFGDLITNEEESPFIAQFEEDMNSNTSLSNTYDVKVNYGDNSKDISAHLDQLNKKDLSGPMKTFETKFGEIASKEATIVRDNLQTPYDNLIPTLEKVKSLKAEADSIADQINEYKALMNRAKLTNILNKFEFGMDALTEMFEGFGGLTFDEFVERMKGYNPLSWFGDKSPAETNVGH